MFPVNTMGAALGVAEDIAFDIAEDTAFESVEVAGETIIDTVLEEGGAFLETGELDVAGGGAKIESSVASGVSKFAQKLLGPKVKPLLDEILGITEKEVQGAGETNIDFITRSEDPIAALEEFSGRGGDIFGTRGQITESLTEGMTEGEITSYLNDVGMAEEFHAAKGPGLDLGEQLMADLEQGIEDFAARSEGEITTNLSTDVSEAVYNHFGDIIDELKSGRFVKKTVQAKILEQITGKIKTGNKDADNILHGISNVVTGGVAFAELSEATAFVIDSIGHLGVPIPQFLHDEFGGSVAGGAFDGLSQGLDHFADTLDSITRNIEKIPGANELIPGLSNLPQIAPLLPGGDTPTIAEEPPVQEGEIIPPGGQTVSENVFNGRIEILSERGNKAPTNEGIFIPTRPTGVDTVVIDTADPNRDPTQGRPIEGDVFAPPATLLPGVPTPTGPKDPVGGMIAYDEDGTEIPMNQHSISHITDPTEVGLQLGNLVGHAANHFSKLSKGTDKSDISQLHKLALKSFNVTAQRFPKSSYMASIVYNYLVSSPEFNTPDTEEYLAIARVYNGKNLAPNRMFRNTSDQISALDEVGVVTSYTGGVGSVPAYDEFCGPFSPNSTFPTTLLGVFCFFHDTDYDNEGYFSKTADYKFMSRISQNLHRMGYQERIIARITLDYFSNVGVVLGALKTKFLPDNIDKVPVDTGLGGVPDIFSVLVPEQVDSNLQAQGLQKRTTVRDQARTNFYAGVRAGVEKVEKQNIQDVRGGGMSPGLGNTALYDSFMALTVVSI